LPRKDRREEGVVIDMTRILLLLCAVVALAAAGCGSSDNSSSSSSSSASTPAASSSSANSGGVAIQLKGFQFSPKDTTVKVGQKITWTNEDTTNHNVTADSGASFKSKDFGQGGTFSFTPTKAGKIAYECTLHPGMKASITVQ
jgi:plastocyanin